jgi:hypothetical protein
MDKVLKKRWDEHNKMETYSEMDASPSQIPEPVHIQIKAQNAYGLGLLRSLYGWKDNDETFPMPLVSPPDSTGVIRNHQNNSESRNYFGAATPY